MVDLITRLQVCAKWDPDQAEAIEVIQAQAARIAELEAALRDVLPYVDTCNSSHREAQAKGYAVLKGGKS